jgi:hypothetical protein
MVSNNPTFVAQELSPSFVGACGLLGSLGLSFHLNKGQSKSFASEAL